MEKSPVLSAIFAFAIFTLIWSWNERVQAERQVELYRHQIEGMKDALGYTH